MRITNYILIVIAGLAVSGCSKQLKENDDVSIKSTPALNRAIEKYISQKIQDSTRVSDSLVLNSTGATLYRLRAKGIVYDAPVYTLIRDHSTDTIFSIVLPGWPGGIDPSCDEQLEILSGRGHPTHSFLNGLEDFMNQRGTLLVLENSIDSIISFWWPGLTRINDESKIETILGGYLKGQDTIKHEQWLSNFKNLVQEKIKDPKVHIYTGLFYVEVRSLNTDKNDQDKKVELISFRIAFQGCPKGGVLMD